MRTIILRFVRDLAQHVRRVLGEVQLVGRLADVVVLEDAHAVAEEIIAD